MPSPLIAAAHAAPTTPALVVDADTLDRNITRMSERAHAGTFDLMPHAKTHKCRQIAEKQLSSGACGLTVATIGEAETFADMGGAGLFIAYPLWLDDGKQRRLAKLAAQTRVRVGVDSVENARRIAGTGATVVIEIDSGHHRTGVQPAEAGVLASAVADLGLTVEGVFTFPGHGTAYTADVTPGEVRAAAAQDQENALAEAARSLVAAGINPVIVSGGSTPTYAHRKDGLISEMRPGVYVFNDAMQVALGSCDVEDVALAAAATVVSVPAPGRFVLDAGSKVLGADPNAWSPGYGLVPAYPGSKVVQLSEHHSVVQLPEGVTAPQHGDRVAIIPNHVCNAVNLAAELNVVQDGTHVDSWPVAARGLNS